MQTTSSPAVGVVPLVVGGVLVGTLAYLALRPRAAAASLPVTPLIPARTGSVGSTPVFTPPPPSGVGAAVTTTVGANGPDPSPALVARLQSSERARLIFGVQALAYSYNYSDAIPDGIESPVTDAIISGTTGVGSYNSSTLADERANIDARNLGPPRLLPFTLPQDVIDRVNNTITFVDSGAHLLQVLPQVGPSVTSPAGQAVIAYPGFRRQSTQLPTNSVGANPGFATVIDPRGLNVGLWEAEEANRRARIGTGVVAADVDRNPVAGQGGGYRAGWR